MKTGVPAMKTGVPAAGPDFGWLCRAGPWFILGFSCLLRSHLPRHVVSSSLPSLVFAASSSANRDIWFGLRWRLGGGVASTRSEGVGAQRTDCLRTALAPPAKRGGRHPRHVNWAGRKRQLNTTAPSAAVTDRGRAMANNKELVASGGRGSKELDKKLIRLE
jgi:hypothetical protein